MKISVSNIAWTEQQDDNMLSFLKEHAVDGLEVAPTRIIPQEPYEHCEEAAEYADHLYQQFHLSIPSMQSIWYGKSENMFHSKEERDLLTLYTKKAIDFAASMRCKNLVFGCPRNRAYGAGEDLTIAVPFFEELGQYADEAGTVLAMEANPPVYHTNFCNETLDAVRLVQNVDSNGFKLNLDLGTMLQNGEDINILEGIYPLISHVHISEPGLLPIMDRDLHRILSEKLQKHGYKGFISLEMKNQENLNLVKESVLYLKEIFG